MIGRRRGKEKGSHRAAQARSGSDRKGPLRKRRPARSGTFARDSLAGHTLAGYALARHSLARDALAGYALAGDSFARRPLGRNALRTLSHTHGFGTFGHTVTSFL